MAELTSGAVSSLLGLLQKEAELLGRVGSDVDFIREEMESMNSFLEHLSRTGGHNNNNKQVRTWMKQVRDLAHDCSNCVDYYLQSGDLAVHVARGGLRRYFWWTYWPAQKMLAQHRAAMRLRELKDRVSDVGKRRLRYGVEIPGKGAGAGAAAAAAGPVVGVQVAEDEDDDEDTQNRAAAAAGGPIDPRPSTLEPRPLEDFFAEKLLNWITSSSSTQGGRHHHQESGSGSGYYMIPSIAIVARDAHASADAAQGVVDFAAAYFGKTVSINLQQLHHPWDLPLLPQELLCYILRECEECKQKQQGAADQADEVEEREQALEDRSKTCDEIWEKIDKMNIHDKIDQVNTMIGQVQSNKAEETKRLKATMGIPLLDKPLGVLHRALQLLCASVCKTTMTTGRLVPEIMQETARMLKKHMEDVVPEPPILLDETQYQDILRKVFLDSKPPQAQQTSNNTTGTTLAEDHIKEILNNHKVSLDNHKIALEIIQGLLPGRVPQLPEGHSVSVEQAKGQGAYNKNSAIDATTKQIEKMDENSWETKPHKNKTSIAAIEETMEKIKEVSWLIEISLLIKGIVDKIKMHLESEKTLIIITDDSDYISQWEGIRNALSLLTSSSSSGSAAVIVITKNIQKAKEYCSTTGEPITYSLVGLYHDILLKITSQREIENGGGKINSQILHDILDMCDPDEFCMRMFAHALYANPSRTYEELRRLHQDLQVSKNKIGTDTGMATDATKNAKIIFKFSYRDLPREYKTCLLYLSVFPQGYKIQRSALIERWAIEGLITKEDWPTVVRHAERCFEILIDRWLVMPVDLSAAGKVKSCMVGSLVHEFITKMASKQHILDARLSQLRARHFSTFSGLRLRASDSIDSVVQKLPKYLHKLRLLKLLDLEGCHGLDKKHLKDICSTILHLKYLSLRGTDVADLPSEINNLHELEILDIRQTKVPEKATRGIVLLKLRRLLAGQTNVPDTGHQKSMLPREEEDKPLRSAVQIPHKINKMENMEVLSNVKAYSRDGAELKEIRKLGQLRKLGVAINNKKSHLRHLLWAISDLKECLQSLSITILKTRSEVVDPDQPLLPRELYNHLIQPPKVLESLSIDGCTKIVQLLTLFAKGSHELAKVSLSRTSLEKKNLFHITMLPKLRCVRLRHNAYIDSRLTIDKEEFPHLKNFHVEYLHKTELINFENGAAPELEKIVLFHTKIKHLCGVGALPKLKELELKGNKDLVSLPEDGTASGVSLHEDGTTSGVLVPEDGTTAFGELVTEISTLTFKKEEFQHLKYFLLEGPSKQTDIKFEGGAPELEKIILSDANIKSLVGVSDLVKLREIDLKGNRALLSLFATANHVAKVTLSDTFLKQHDLQILAKKPKLCWLALLDNSYDECKLTFSEDEFPKLKVLIMDCSTISSISFAEVSACKLEKIRWSFSKLESLSGIANLPELKELEFHGDSIPLEVRKKIHAHNKKLTHIRPQLQDNVKEGLHLGEKKKSTFFPVHPSVRR